VRRNPLRKEMMACQEMEARQEEKEPTSVETKPEVAQQDEVPETSQRTEEET
jgi:hypothetical protein